LISECYQGIKNEDESGDIEKSERSIAPRFQAPIEVDRPAMERTQMMTEDPCTGPRGVRSLLTIRMEDIERPHRNDNYLR
jgi:hypothetical protein